MLRIAEITGRKSSIASAFCLALLRLRPLTDASRAKRRNGGGLASAFVVNVDAIFADKIVGILAVGQNENLDVKFLRQQMFDRPPRGLYARRIAVVIDDDALGKAAEQL